MARHSVHPRSSRAVPRGLALHFRWGDQRVGEHFLAPGEETALTVGTGAGTHLAMGDHLLGAPTLDVVRSDASGYVLRFTREMEGELHRGGEVRTLREVVESGEADDEGDAYGLPLERRDRAWVDLGGVVLEGSFQPVPRKVVVPLAETIDFTALNAFLVMTFLGALFVITALNSDVEGRGYADALSSAPAQVARFLKPPEPRRTSLVVQPDLQKTGEAAPRARGPAGKMGDRAAPDRHARTAVKGDADQKANAQALARRVFGPNAKGGVAILFGEKGLHNDLTSAMGHLIGAAPGAAQGFGGLGLRDLGPGGGGDRESIGIGPIGTHGRAGRDSRYGDGSPGLAPKQKPHPEITPTDPIVTGSLDKELIRAVIKRHVGQIRYCYESHLNRFPTLTGKVAARFVISSSGSVSSSEVAQSTVGNASLESCVTDRVRAWQFPKPKGGVVVVTYPFLFRQSGG